MTVDVSLFWTITIMSAESNSSPTSRLKNYLIFLLVLSIIFACIAINRSFLIAPPYAVTAYLVIFQRETPNARIKNILSTYLLVIVSSYLIHVLLGDTVPAMAFNLVLISAFITFTDFTHPPAIALTVFSYLTHDQLAFTEASLLALAVIVASSLVLVRTGRKSGA